MKRAFDIAVSLSGLVALSPVMLTVGAITRKKLGSPVLFKQERPGLHGKTFTLIKFRTMRDAYDEDGNPLDDSERMTEWGQFLRKTSLDELPTLWNVLKGDMSIVGPRPLLVQYLALYNERQARRHDVKPGVTGWAQVNGRNAISWEEKFELDVWYVENKSFLLDLQIIAKTIGKVLQSEGISSTNHVTMDFFRGTSPQEDAETIATT
ncbi:MAG: sugar transferase [Deltaproteobacteria bacterium]|nr:sugar transferase [Deltaproteobacteria bacterium]MBK05266.1 sugar transferase [Deltaproteobacteria bacterium]|tara:strand:- start:250 stop:873 length:624 start_codon:yes stop_codon:yes gene_type:complete